MPLSRPSSNCEPAAASNEGAPLFTAWLVSAMLQRLAHPRRFRANLCVADFAGGGGPDQLWTRASRLLSPVALRQQDS